MRIQVLVKQLNQYLECGRFVESSLNGLQVKASNTGTKVAGAVDATVETITKAAQKKCDLLIVHHGIKWRGEKSVVYDKRMRLAKKLGVSIYAAHLPLDIHPQGNAASILTRLGITKTMPFGKHHGVYWGKQGALSASQSLTTVKNKLEKICDTKAITLFFGKKKIKRIACVTGGGSFALEEAIQKKYDLLITGDLAYWVTHDAKESKINVIALGHYQTETFGVKSVLNFLKTFNLPAQFIDGDIPK